MALSATESAELVSVIEECEEGLTTCFLTDQKKLAGELERLQLSLARQEWPGRGKIDRARILLERSRHHVLGRLETMPEPSYPGNLPVSECCDEIVRLIQENQVVVIAGETGSGKTTQIPKMCLSAGLGGRGMIGCTQPRRVAALSISKRVAEELEVEWGKKIGCKIRFNDDTSGETLIKFMTDGMLLAEAQGDPDLSEYELLIIDEAHERSLNIDFIIGYLRILLDKRPDLKVIITSATIDTKAFSEAFGGAPILEVSGKVYPVEVVYQPWEQEDEFEDGEYTFIDAAVDAVDSLLFDPSPGDFLVFMPGERDIRETRDLMEARFGHHVDILPLFGRLSSAEQQRIFSTGDRKRVVIATNIAETSITIPNIRFVVDSGLARISRFSPRTRTKRLPVEGISQSSANQRKGRCGRVADGICVRLYSEEDFESRPLYTQPELQRCNLAEVILRMKAFHLGDIETFPFLNPPQDNAIRNGYKLLQELGALDDNGTLTRLGERLARLPVDPMIGRMVIQATEEKALSEVLIIASALSIQDPRERPMELEKQADTAHQAFKDEHSDFITILNLWNSLNENSRALKTQNQLRKFCKKNFISYMRYREWRDIYQQLKMTLKDIGGFEWNSAEASHDAIHRSILTGLIVQTGAWVEKNWYKSPGNRKVMVFPGSVLFRSISNRERKLRQKGKTQQDTSDRSGQPRWILAGEFMETSQLFARNLARIRPEWIIEFGEYLCRFSYHEPRWDKKSQRVVVKERVTLKGLEILTRTIDLKKINPQDATEIFIREALVAGEMHQPSPFLDHNQRIIDEVETWQRRVRDISFSRMEERIYDFYAARFEGVAVSSVHDLNRQLKDWCDKDPHYLEMNLEDLTQGTSLDLELGNYPDKLSCGGHIVEFDYAYAPGEEHDGVTMRIPAVLSTKVTQSLIEWLVPGYRREKVENLIRLLPRQFRKELMPVSDISSEIAESLKPRFSTLAEDLTHWVRQNRGLDIPTALWEINNLPEYLKTKIAILNQNGDIQFSGRDISEFQQYLKTQSASVHKERFVQIVRRFEKHAVRQWDFGDLPEQVEISTPGSPSAWIFPGLYLDGDEVHVRAFKTLEDAQLASLPAYRRLGALALGKDMLWLERDLHAIEEAGLLAVSFSPVASLIIDATDYCLRVLFPASSIWPLNQKAFEVNVATARGSVSKLGKWAAAKMSEVIQLRHQILSIQETSSPIGQELAILVPPHFLHSFNSKEDLSWLPRSLKARKIRAERATSNPDKDQKKWERVAKWVNLSRKWSAFPRMSPDSRTMAREFAAMVEEFYISQFAQELGTRFPVSEKKLEEMVVKACDAGHLSRG